jgi:uncharacterized repeat protein (TIGR04061 family)
VILACPATARLDADLFDALTVPARLADYPRDSRNYARIDRSLRLYWHALFDICPRLLDLAGLDGAKIFQPFMAWASEQGVGFGWTTYLWVAEWLAQQPEFADRLDEALRIDLMGASVARWAVFDRSADAGLALAHPDVAGLVVGWKCRAVDVGRQVELVEPDEPLPAPSDGFGFFTLPGFDLDRFPGWRAIPK